MTIAILGSGSVGSALGGRLAAAGIDVIFGARDPKAPSGELPAGTQVRSIPDAVAAASLVLLAVPAAAALATARAAGDLTGKILVDCTNPLSFDALGPVWTPPVEGSGAQALAAALPGVRVVKAFNHFGAEIHGNPRVAGGAADALVAGDDAAARAAVVDLANRIGFHGVDAGPLRNAGLLENLAILWIHLAVKGGLGRQFAFRGEVRD